MSRSSLKTKTSKTTTKTRPKDFDARPFRVVCALCSVCAHVPMPHEELRRILGQDFLVEVYDEHEEAFHTHVYNTEVEGFDLVRDHAHEVFDEAEHVPEPTFEELVGMFSGGIVTFNEICDLFGLEDVEEYRLVAGEFVQKCFRRTRFEACAACINAIHAVTLHYAVVEDAFTAETVILSEIGDDDDVVAADDTDTVLGDDIFDHEGVEDDLV